MLKHCLGLCLVFFTLLSTSGSVFGRTFTDTKGRKIEAEILGVEGGKVEFKLDKNGKTYEVALGKLSEADREFIRKRQEEAQKKKHGLRNNFDAEWPGLVSTDIGIGIKVVSEDEAGGKFVYHSPNYEFICDVALSQNVVKKFAVMFEATREYCRLMPIATMKAHVPGEQFRHKILLFEAQESYMKNGGIPGSAGVFISRGGNGVVMAPLTSLGVIKGKGGYRFDYDGSNKTLPHELAHQLTDVEYFTPGARGWFS